MITFEAIKRETPGLILWFVLVCLYYGFFFALSAGTCAYTSEIGIPCWTYFLLPFFNTFSMLVLKVPFEYAEEHERTSDSQWFGELVTALLTFWIASSIGIYLLHLSPAWMKGLLICVILLHILLAIILLKRSGIATAISFSIIGTMVFFGVIAPLSTVWLFVPFAILGVAITLLTTIVCTAIRARPKFIV